LELNNNSFYFKNLTGQYWFTIANNLDGLEKRELKNKGTSEIERGL